MSVGPHRPPLVAAAGFRLFGTATTTSVSGPASAPLFSESTLGSPNPTLPAKPLPPTALFGLGKLFLHVAVAPLDAPSGEVAAVIRSLFPSLPQTIIDPLLRSFDAIADLSLGRVGASSVGSGSCRVPCIRDVQKVAHRVAASSADTPGSNEGSTNILRLTTEVKCRVVAEIVDVSVVGSANEAFVRSAARSLGGVWELHPDSIVE